MGNALEFILRLTDQLSPAMRAAATVTDSAAGRIGADLDRAASRSRAMSSSISDLRQRLESVNQVRLTTRIQSQFDEATKEARKLERQLERLENRGKSGGGGSMLAGALGGLGVGMLGGSALKMAGEREQQKVSFGVMTGSQATGDKMLDDIVKMGARTPFESGDLIKAAQTMKQFGIENKAVLPNLNMLGDVAGGNAEKLQSLALAYSQVQSTGRLQGQDLLQLINAGFNPLLTISQQTGLSMGQLKEKMEKGAISANMVTKAFQTATGPGGQFYQMMEKQSLTLNGRWSTFMDNAKAKLLDFGNMLMPAASGLLNFGSALLDGEPAAIALAIAIGGLTIAWMASKAALDGTTISMRLLAFWQGIVNVVMNMNPIFVIITLLIALGFWIYSLCKKYEGWGQSLQGVWEIIKGFVKLNVIAWKDLGENIWYWIQYAWLKVKGFVEWIGGAMGNVFKALSLASQFKFGEAKAALTAEIKTTTSSQLDALEKKHKSGQLENAKASVAAVKQMADGYGMIGLKKKATPAGGAAPATTNTTTTDGKGDPVFDALGTGGVKSKADNINSGGARPITVTINKAVETVNIRVADAREAAQDLASLIREEIRRTISSVNSLSTE